MVKGRARGPQPQGVGAEVDLPADDSRLELGRGIAPIPIAIEEPRQVREEEDDHAGIGAKLLLEAEIAGLAPKSALLQQLKGTVRWREVEGAVREALNVIGDEIGVKEGGPGPAEKVWGRSPGRSVNEGGELREGDRRAGEPARLA